MRILIILNPTNKWGTKTEYTNLRKFLMRVGIIPRPLGRNKLFKMPER